MKGIYPYVLPTEGASEDTVITAWFKKGTVPSNKLDSDAYNLNQLSSFDISLNSENKINYQFTPYSPENATSDENATESTKLFGKVQYTVIVTDNNGQIVHQESFSSPTGTINYTVNQNVKVTGYYNYEKAKAETFLCFFHVQIYQRKELCQWIFHGSCYLNCWVRLQIQSVMFSAAQRKIEKNENRR